MKILYIIQLHKNPSQTIKLLDILCSPLDYYLLNVDPAAEFDSLIIDQYFDDRRFSNYRIRKSLPLVWGGHSQVLAWIDVLTFARHSLTEWDFVINLSGDCLPVRPPDAVRSKIEEIHLNGYEVIIQHQSNIGSPEDDTILRYEWQEDKESDRQISVEKMNWPGRADVYIQEDIAHIFNSSELNPIMRWHRRLSIYCNDIFGTKTLAIRALFPHEVKNRFNFLKKIKFSTGRVWFAMSSNFVTDMLQDDLFWEIVSGFENTICSDEQVFASYVATLVRDRSLRAVNWNLHFKGGDAVNALDDLASSIVASDAYFVRKVNYEQCPALLKLARLGA
jgi:hypothetical protein